MIDASALELAGDRVRVKPAAAASCNKPPARFGLLRSQKTAAMKSGFRRVLKLQHRAVMLLRQLFQGGERSRIVQIAEDNHHRSIGQRGCDLRDSSSDVGFLVVAE